MKICKFITLLLMNCVVYGQKINEKLKEQNRCKTCKQQKCYLNKTSKPSYMSYKRFDNDLVAIRKNINDWQTCIQWNLYLVNKVLIK